MSSDELIDDIIGIDPSGRKKKRDTYSDEQSNEDELHIIDNFVFDAIDEHDLQPDHAVNSMHGDGVQTPT